MNSTKQSRYILFGLYFILIIGFLQQASSRVCTTKKCHTLSRYLSDNMRTSVNPCDDFYEYACGGWVQQHPRKADDYQTYSRAKQYETKLENKLCGLLQDKISSTDLKAVKAAKIQYQACIDDDKLKAQGLRPLINIINENGGWPMIENSTFVSTKPWQEVHDNYLVKTGVGSIMNVIIDGRNKLGRILISDGHPAFTLPLDPTDKAKVDSRIEFIIQVAEKFAAANGAEIDNIRMKEDAAYIHYLDQALNALENNNGRTNSGPFVSIEAANGLLVYGLKTKFNLFRGLQRIFRNVPGAYQLENSEIIRLNGMSYLRGALEVLSTFTDRDILNYIHFHFVVRQIYQTTPDMRMLYGQYFEMPASNRSVECMEAVNLRRVLSYMYLKRYFSPADQKAAESLVNDIKASIERQIKESDWIDQKSMSMAIQKLKNLDISVGYRNWFANATEVEEVYSQYNMGDNYMLNLLNFHEVEFKQYLSQFGSYKDQYTAKHKKVVYPVHFTSTYYVRFNRLDIPATNLHLPFFNRTLPHLANYAGAGVLVANIMADMYDDTGRYFDDRGHLSQWLSADSATHFEERYGCYGTQLVNYTLQALRNTNVKHTTIHPSEYVQTFVDSFSLKTAYDAYMKKITVDGMPNIELPRLSKFSAEKQFFLAFANPFCESKVGTSLADFAENGSAMTSQLRVNTAVSNLPQFSTVFNCPDDSPMNPTIKCKFF